MICERCGKEMEKQSSSHKYCSECNKAIAYNRNRLRRIIKKYEEKPEEDLNFWEMEHLFSFR